uniref:C-X-C chemokine receptor type 3-like n=1 Tax=Pristiophorus japonicus TaxID=55135 RepID=UPI00398F4A4C
MATEVEFLRRKIVADGFRPTDAKTEAIRIAPRPQNVTELRSSTLRGPDSILSGTRAASTFAAENENARTPAAAAQIGGVPRRFAARRSSRDLSDENPAQKTVRHLGGHQRSFRQEGAFIKFGPIDNDQQMNSIDSNTEFQLSQSLSVAAGMGFSLDSFQLLDIWDANSSSDDFLNNSYDPTHLSDACDTFRVQSFYNVFLPIFYLAIFCVGLLGNGIALAVLLRNRRMLAVTDIYILYLTIADILLVASLPFWAIETVKGWVFGSTACKIIGAMFNINFNSSIYLLGCISFQRYLSIVHAVQMYNKRKSLSVHISCLVVWLFCHLLAIPDFIYLREKRSNGVSQCHYDFDGKIAKAWMTGLRFFYHITSFLAPMTIMFYCYVMIVKTLCGSHNMQKNKERRAMKVIVMVVAALFICWVPYNVVLFIDTLQRLGVIARSCVIESRLDIAIAITSNLGYFHCCLNPFLYAFAGVKFRRNLLQIFSDLGCIGQKTVKNYTKSGCKQTTTTMSESGDTVNSRF